jgi:hypothetical protein
MPYMTLQNRTLIERIRLTTNLQDIFFNCRKIQQPLSLRPKGEADLDT